MGEESIFPDHHVYSRLELERAFSRWQAGGIEAVLTTQKDVMNLPAGLHARLPLFACCIQIEIEPSIVFEQALLAAVEQAKREP